MDALTWLISKYNMDRRDEFRNPRPYKALEIAAFCEGYARYRQANPNIGVCECDCFPCSAIRSGDSTQFHCGLSECWKNGMPLGITFPANQRTHGSGESAQPQTFSLEPIDIEKALLGACVGHPSAAIPWPHRLLHDAADAIRELRTEINDMKYDLKESEAEYERSRNYDKFSREGY